MDNINNLQTMTEQCQIDDSDDSIINESYSVVNYKTQKRNENTQSFSINVEN
jgi:hypothetical protein